MKVTLFKFSGPLAALMLSGGVLVGPMITPAVSAERVMKLGYEIYLGGLNIFGFDADFAFDRDRYRIKGGGKTKGVVRMFWRWGVDATARGIINGHGVEAQRYDVITARRKGDKHLQVAFKGDGAYGITRLPVDTPHRAQKRDLPDFLPRLAVDPLSAAMVVSHRLGQGQTCGSQVPVFDGDRRYNLDFQDLGDEHLKRPGYLAFIGSARRCRFVMKQVSGFRKQKIKLRFWDDDKLEQPIIWMASVAPGLPAVPVQFQADFNLGYMMLYLVKASYKGRTLMAVNKGPKK
ncbi:MAG: DUF3108 domain-containing protein [Rhodospirillales bacterium]|jgi:hypothetical protein|nr:DUF3108 domain-containing protein [Rhodospirillales bacterium]MBT4006319.1 DUF3108 domain-containing protein [Rhodospirillales bacterium]MBT5076841.1 DUF3108 domain-containing protein [Rhodospirillales bacterium]MBT5114196.1 DUF3108 domain-containing protein [Rhodospirillales bacterium]MBT5673066.1 DUF3108 domain-containing protein [Rhodospirillales bacterium]